MRIDHEHVPQVRCGISADDDGGRWDETWRETGASPIRAGYVRKRSHDASRLNRRHDTRGEKTHKGEKGMRV